MLDTWLLRWMGPGWAYRLPWYYHREIDRRFGATRVEGFEYITKKLLDIDPLSTCLDIATGTGATAIWMASRYKDLRVVGIDLNDRMLRAARRQALRWRVADRCRFLTADAAAVTHESLGTERVDIVTCSLGLSVIPNWRESFVNTVNLLHENGTYVVFDEFVEGLTVPAFSSDQTRRSWEPLEETFLRSETKWFGDCFIAVGTGKRPDKGSSSV